MSLSHGTGVLVSAAVFTAPMLSPQQQRKAGILDRQNE